MNGEGGDVNFKISELIMALRNTLNITEQSANYVMFGRQIRTRLDNFQETQRIPGKSELMDKSRFVTSMKLQ